MKRFLVPMMLLALAGCITVGDIQGGDDDDDDNTKPAPVGTAAPLTGIWHYDEANPSTNDCQSDQVVSNGTGDFGLENHGDGTVTIHPNDESLSSFVCTLDGNNELDCPKRAFAEEDVTGYNATVTALATAIATFRSQADGAGRQFLDVECTGTDCGEVEILVGETFPCSFTVDFEISWVSTL